VSDKMECPGCEAETSSVLGAVKRGEPCPYCGLSADAIEAVTEARKRHGETQMVAQLAAALKRAETAEARAAHLSRALDTIERALRGAKETS
jgi:uncharacterized membrane-anchored protein